MSSDVAGFEWGATNNTSRGLQCDPAGETSRSVLVARYCDRNTERSPTELESEMASTVVEETMILATDPDITTQLEGSEETRQHKHKTLPRNVNRDRHDARQDAHLQR